MKQIRVPMVTGQAGLQAAMPTFNEIAGSYQGDPAVASAGGVRPGIPLGDPRLGAVTVLVEVPDDEVDASGNVDKRRVKQKYPDHFLTRMGRFD